MEGSDAMTNMLAIQTMSLAIIAVLVIGMICLWLFIGSWFLKTRGPDNDEELTPRGFITDSSTAWDFGDFGYEFRVTFSEFMDFYSLNPDRYVLRDDGYSYTVESSVERAPVLTDGPSIEDAAIASVLVDLGNNARMRNNKTIAVVREKYSSRINRNVERTVMVGFSSRSDLSQYRRWLRDSGNTKAAARQSKMTNAKLEYLRTVVTADIDALRRLSDDEISQATENILDIQQRVEPNDGTSDTSNVGS